MIILFAGRARGGWDGDHCRGQHHRHLLHRGVRDRVVSGAIAPRPCLPCVSELAWQSTAGPGRCAESVSSGHSLHAPAQPATASCGPQVCRGRGPVYRDARGGHRRAGSGVPPGLGRAAAGCAGGLFAARLPCHRRDWDWGWRGQGGGGAARGHGARHGRGDGLDAGWRLCLPSG